MDDIRRKLALIDEQLAGGRNFHKQIISTAPLLFAAAGLMAGILIQNILGLPSLVWIILLALCAIGAFIFFAIQRFSFNNQLSIITNQFIMAYLALVCFACLGAIRLINYYQPRPNDIRHLVGSEERLATIRGLIITQPFINKNRQWEFARFKYTDPSSSFYLKVSEVKTIDGWVRTVGTVRVQVTEPVLDLKAGDYIQAYCWLDRFKEAANPGQFNTAKYLARKNVFIAASVKSHDSIELLKSYPKSVFTKIKRKLRETATQALVGD